MKNARLTLENIRELVMQLPSGVDMNADPMDESPEDMTAHIGGLIVQTIDKALLEEKKSIPKKVKPPQTCYDCLWDLAWHDGNHSCILPWVEDYKDVMEWALNWVPDGNLPTLPGTPPCPSWRDMVSRTEEEKP